MLLRSWYLDSANFQFSPVFKDFQTLTQECWSFRDFDFLDCPFLFFNFPNFLFSNFSLSCLCHFSIKKYFKEPKNRTQKMWHKNCSFPPINPLLQFFPQFFGSKASMLRGATVHMSKHCQCFWWHFLGFKFFNSFKILATEKPKNKDRLWRIIHPENVSKCLRL